MQLSPVKTFNLVDISPVKMKDENIEDVGNNNTNRVKDSLVNKVRRNPNCLFSKVILQRVNPIETPEILEPNLENPESPEIRKPIAKRNGEIISPERNPFRRNRFADKSNNENVKEDKKELKL